MDFLPIILDLVSKYPVLASIFMVIGVLRTVNKPLFSLLRSFVDATPSAKDNEILDKVESSKVYKAIAYVLDWFGSVKIPVVEAKK